MENKSRKLHWNRYVDVTRGIDYELYCLLFEWERVETRIDILSRNFVYQNISLQPIACSYNTTRTKAYSETKNYSRVLLTYFVVYGCF